MKKLIIFTVFFILFGCNRGNYKLTQITECFYPDSPKNKAPLWVCKAKVEDLKVSSVGIAPLSKAGLQFSIEQATVAARSTMAQELQTQIQSYVTNNITSMGNYTNEEVEQIAKSVTKQVTTATLVGAKMYRYVVSPNNNIYVLVGLDNENYKNTLQSVFNSTKKNTNNNVVKSVDFSQLSNNLENVN